MTTIETGIPIPASKAGRPKTSPIYKMNIGDSFTTTKIGRINAYACAKRNGVKITSRKQENGTFRIWRTK